MGNCRVDLPVFGAKLFSRSERSWFKHETRTDVVSVRQRLRGAALLSRACVEVRRMAPTSTSARIEATQWLDEDDEHGQNGNAVLRSELLASGIRREQTSAIAVLAPTQTGRMAPLLERTETPPQSARP